MEVNPRLQVEHTLTEAVTGLDLVAIQLRLAEGATLAELGLAQPPAPRGFALQMRINAESLMARRPEPGPKPAASPASACPRVPASASTTRLRRAWSSTPPMTACWPSWSVHGPDRATCLARATAAIGEFRIEGVRTLLPMMARILTLPDFQADRIDTRFIEAHAGGLADPEEGTPGAHPGTAAPGSQPRGAARADGRHDRGARRHTRRDGAARPARGTDRGDEDADGGAGRHRRHDPSAWVRTSATRSPPATCWPGWIRRTARPVISRASPAQARTATARSDSRNAVRTPPRRPRRIAGPPAGHARRRPPRGRSPPPRRRPPHRARKPGRPVRCRQLLQNTAPSHSPPNAAAARWRS